MSFVGKVKARVADALRKFLQFMERYAPYAIFLSLISFSVIVIFGIIQWKMTGTLDNSIAIAFSILGLTFGLFSIFGQLHSSLHLASVTQEVGDVLIGWDRYIGRSSELYSNASKIKAVISEWEIDERIEDALVSNNKLEDGIFVGLVERGAHFIGVLWRLNVWRTMKMSDKCNIYVLPKKSAQETYAKYLIMDEIVVVPRKKEKDRKLYIACVYPEKSGLAQVFKDDFSREYMENITLDDARVVARKIVLEGIKIVSREGKYNMKRLLSYLLDYEIDDTLEAYDYSSESGMQKELVPILRDFISKEKLGAAQNESGKTASDVGKEN